MSYRRAGPFVLVRHERGYALCSRHFSIGLFAHAKDEPLRWYVSTPLFELRTGRIVFGRPHFCWVPPFRVRMTQDAVVAKQRREAA